MNAVADYSILDWDSRTFGIPVASLSNPEARSEQLRNLLNHLREKGIRLAYFPARTLITDETIMHDFDGVLADEKVTFIKQLSGVEPTFTDPNIHSYPAGTVSDELLLLAFDSGLYSRFRVDGHFVHQEYQVLYKAWIERSVTREIAHEVLVYEVGGHLMGMVTLGEKKGRGDIGLVAVSGLARGRGIGKKLMAAAEADFIHRGYRNIQVVTQGVNEAAMKLYMSSGFTLEEKLYYYHFWL